jgi:hypothetical protein
VARFDQPIEPMTLGNMRELGVRSLNVSCWLCHHQAVLSAEPLAGRRRGADLRSSHGLHRLRHRWCGCPAELEGAAAAGEADRGAMATLSRKGTKVRWRTLELYRVRPFDRRRAQLRGNDGVRQMARPTELETYTKLADVCLWEADRTFDREVEQSLRTLADRFRQMSEREPHVSRSTER